MQEHPIQDLEGLLKKSQEDRELGVPPKSVLLSVRKDTLNTVRVVVKDKNKPLTSANAQVYLNGQLLPMVKGFNLMLDSSGGLAVARLDLYAHFTVEEAKDGPDDTTRLS